MADRAAFSTSRSFSAAILFQCFAMRSKNFRSSELLVFEAYHSHWRAFSAHSAIVIAHPRLGATLRQESKCLLRNAYVTGITGLSKATDFIKSDAPQSSSASLLTDGAVQKEKAPFARGALSPSVVFPRCWFNEKTTEAGRDAWLLPRTQGPERGGRPPGQKDIAFA